MTQLGSLGNVAAWEAVCYSPPMRMPLGRVAAVFLALTAAAKVANAYVIPADFLMKLLAEKRRELKVRDLSAQLVAEVEGSLAPVDEYLYVKSPERLRLVAQGDDGSSVYIEREGQRAMGPESAPKRLTHAFDLTATLLVPNGRDLESMAARMLAAMRAAGVDTSIVSLGREGDTLAYIVGARPFEPDKPQVWLYKSSFLPLKTVLFDRSRSPASRVEMRFLDYGSPIGGEYLPGVIEVYRDGKRVRRAELTKLSVNQTLPETLFDLPRAR